MEFDSDLLIESLILGLLLGVGLAFVVAIELARIPWLCRAAAPVAMAWLLLPTKAYPAITYFLLTSLQILAMLEFARWWRGRRDAAGRSKARASFTLRFMFSAVALIAAVCGVGVIAVKDINDVLSQLGSSVASSTLVVAVTWCVLARQRKRLRFVVLLAALSISTTLWYFTVWFDIYETRIVDSAYFFLSSHSPLMLMACDAAFGLVLAVCVATMILACDNRKAVPAWQVRHARRVAVPIVIAAVLLGGFFYYRLTRPIPIPTTVLPNPNGHDLFAQAGKPLRSVTVPDVETAQPTVVAQFANQHRETLSLVRQGLKQECMTVLIWKEGANYFNDQFDSFQDARQVGRLFQAEAFAHVASQEFSEAAQSCIDCIRFSHAMSRRGLAIHFLVQSAIEGTGTRDLHKCVGQLDSSTARAAARQLFQVDMDREPASEFRERDQLWSQVTFGWQARLQLAADDLLTRPDSLAPTQEVEQRSDTIRRLLIAELAVHAFTLEHGSPPRQLNELVPDYLPRIPDDPYGNDPLRYRVEETTATVYSVGPDLNDDSARGLAWNELSSHGDGDAVLARLFESQ